MIKTFYIVAGKCDVCQSRLEECLHIDHSDDPRDYSRICLNCINKEFAEYDAIQRIFDRTLLGHELY